MECKYKWESPLAWLIEKAGTWDRVELMNEFFCIAQKLDNDTIQGLYQSDMGKDGYFDCLTCEVENKEES